MSLFGDGLKAVVSRIDAMRVEFITMTANFQNLEKAFDKFVEQTETKTEKMVKENEDIRRRLTEIEGLMNATMKSSMKEAMQSAIREHLEQNGNVKQLIDKNMKSLLGSSDTESNTGNE